MNSRHHYLFITVTVLRYHRDRRAPDAYSESSQAVLGRAGADLLVACKFRALCSRLRPRERRALVVGQRDQELVISCELQHDARNFILRFQWQPARRLDGLFKQFGHELELAFLAREESASEPGDFAARLGHPAIRRAIDPATAPGPFGVG